MRTIRLLAAGCIAAFSSFSPFTNAQQGPTLNVQTNGQKTVTWGRLPALETNRLGVSGVTGSAITALTTVNSSNVARDTMIYQYKTTNTLPQQFYAIWQSQLSSNDLLAANVLNRLAYGPTP